MPLNAYTKRVLYKYTGLFLNSPATCNNEGES